MILIGNTGYTFAQLLFGLSTSLWMLYAARILVGIASSATLPVSAAYVADMTNDKERTRGMAWLGTTASFGFVISPALGGILSQRDSHFSARYGHFMIDSFSVPFFAAAGLGPLALLAAMSWLPDSLPGYATRIKEEETGTNWRTLVRRIGPLLVLALVGQFGQAIFATTFAIYAQAKLNYRPVQVGAVFVVCGLVMTVFQAGAASLLAGRIRKIYQLAIDFGLMGGSLALLVTARPTLSVFVVVALFAFEISVVSPNLAALISKRGGSRHLGGALAAQNAANSLGQASGPLLGSILFIWQINAPLLLTGALLLVIALIITWKAGSVRTLLESLDHAGTAI